MGVPILIYDYFWQELSPVAGLCASGALKRHIKSMASDLNYSILS
jgi:hypothetical protein